MLHPGDSQDRCTCSLTKVGQIYAECRLTSECCVTAVVEEHFPAFVANASSIAQSLYLHQLIGGAAYRLYQYP